MIQNKQLIHNYCRQFKMGGLSTCLDQMLIEAETNSISYLEYTVNLFKAEALHREYKDAQKRLKSARLPHFHDLNSYDYTFENGFSKTRLNQLRELNWLDQIYNIILMGPSGIGKTFLAAGLCADAVQKGYKAYFRNMEEILNMLKLKDFTASAMADYKRLNKANLIVIDDIMLFPVEKQQAIALFNFINQIYEQTSFIVTTNKTPNDWALMLNDEVLATALLDRLLYHSEVINLAGKSFRLKNRKTIFDPIN
jgi:DNA replication protein DnaC